MLYVIKNKYLLDQGLIQPKLIPLSYKDQIFAEGPIEPKTDLEVVFMRVHMYYNKILDIKFRKRWENQERLHEINKQLTIITEMERIVCQQIMLERAEDKEECYKKLQEVENKRTMEEQVDWKDLVKYN